MMDGKNLVIILGTIAAVIVLGVIGYKIVFDKLTYRIGPSGRVYKVRSDVDDPQAAVAILEELDTFMRGAIDTLKKHKPCQCYTDNLERRYPRLQLGEYIPRSPTDAPAYTFNKNNIVICLRDSKDKNKMVDIDAAKSVLLHELAHAARDKHEKGHPPDFWKTYKLIGTTLSDAGFYTMVDHGKHPIKYCNLTLDSSVLHSSTPAHDDDFALKVCRHRDK